MFNTERRVETLSTVALIAANLANLEASESTVLVTATLVVTTSFDTGTDSTPAASEAASRDEPNNPLEADELKESSIAFNAPSIEETSLSSSNKTRLRRRRFFASPDEDTLPVEIEISQVI